MICIACDACGNRIPAAGDDLRGADLDAAVAPVLGVVRDRNIRPGQGGELPAELGLIPFHGKQIVAIQLGVRAGGSQGPVVKSSVSAWYLSLPHLWAVAR